jgi:hypothetical protein
MNFGNIFSDFPDSLDDWLQAGAKGLVAYNKSKAESASMANIGGSSSTQKGGVAATQSRPADVADPATIDAIWRSRLGKLLETTEVKAATQSKPVKLG